MASRTIAALARTLAAAIACVVTVSGCSQRTADSQAVVTRATSGDARVRLSLSAASAPTVSRVAVAIRPGDGPAFTPIVEELPRSGDSWGGYITGIPAGPGRVFDVSALDSAGQALFTGSGKADVGAGQATQLLIVLQETPGTPFGNSIPVIDKMSANAAKVKPGDKVRVGVKAHDPDAGDTITYLWTAAAGTFDAPEADAAVWTPPDVDAQVVELVVTVSDNRGGSASASMQVTVQRTAVVNSNPVIDKITASASEVKGGDVVQVSVSAHDPDASDALSYQWKALGGAFDAPAAATTKWTAPNQDATVDLVVTVSDGRGGTASASVKVNVKRVRTVSGSRLVTYWPDPPAAAVTSPAPDLAGAVAPRAIVLVAGAWVEQPAGSLRPDGTFSIPGVPPGAYVLCYDPPAAASLCSDATADSVDLGYDVLGRPDQAAATRSTPVALSLTGLDPWNPIWEQVQITSSGANLWNIAAPGPSFRGGDTAGSVVEDWFRPNGGARPLGLLAPDDVLLVHQISTRSIYVGQGIAFYAAATRAASVPGTTLQDGQASSIAVNLAALPLTGQLPVSWDPASFEAHVAALGPPARRSTGPSAHTLLVGASATPIDRIGPAAAGGGFPQLVRMDFPAGAGPVTDTLYYGRFLPSTWAEWRGARFAAQVSYLAPGATLPLVEESAVERRDPIPAAGGALQPAVSPPRTPSLNGTDAFVDQTAVGLTPTLSWLAPTVGTPSGYVVEVYRLSAAGNASTSTLVLRYSTQAVSVTIPRRILEAGATYYARIGARSGLVHYDTAPLRSSPVESRATTLTGTFTP